MSDRNQQAQRAQDRERASILKAEREVGVDQSFEAIRELAALRERLERNGGR